MVVEKDFCKQIGTKDVTPRFIPSHTKGMIDDAFFDVTAAVKFLFELGRCDLFLKIKLKRRKLHVGN